MDGSVLLRFKRAFVDELTTVANVNYQSPMSPEDMNGADGSRLAAWWVDEAEATIELMVATGGPHWFDENATVTLRLQALGKDTDDTQEAVDIRATEALGKAIAILATDPTVGIADTAQVQMFDAVPTGWTYRGGILGSNLRAASYDLDIQVHARLKLETNT